MYEELIEELENMDAEIEDRMEAMGSDEDYFKFLFEFANNQNIVKLREAVKEKNRDVAFAESHTLKGLTLNLGLLPVSDACSIMVIAFKKGNDDFAFEQLARVDKEYTRFADAIKKYEKE